jgi:DNA-3-methyladenine glycosylase II
MQRMREPLTTIEIVPRRPYSLALTAARYARFPEVVDRFDGRVYRRYLEAGGGTLVAVEQVGPPSRARLEVTLAGPGARAREGREAAEALVAGPLGAAADVRPFYRALWRDPVIGEAIRDYAGLKIAGAPSLWEAIVTAVLSQQVNLLFAYDIRRELALAFGARLELEGETWVGFPAPAIFTANARRIRRGFRLSRAKAETLLGLAEAFASGSLSAAELAGLDDEAAIERLTSMRGVGRWTAEIALLRGLGRADVFPAADLGVVKYLATGLLGRAAPAREEEMRAFAERWRPWRGLALLYAYAELQRRRETAAVTRALPERGRVGRAPGGAAERPRPRARSPRPARRGR